MHSAQYQRYEIEHLTPADKYFVQEIVYQAIFVPKGHPAPTRAILNSADIKKYYENWGRKGDCGFLLVNRSTEQPVGGAFIRYYPEDKAGYGFISNKVPELSIALLPDHRGLGQGSLLLQRLLDYLKDSGHQGVSLSVDVKNPALKLYQKMGFKVVRQDGNPTMLLSFVSEPLA